MSSKKGREVRRSRRRAHIEEVNQENAIKVQREKASILLKLRDAPETLTAQEIAKLSKREQQERIDLLTSRLNQRLNA